MSSNRLRTTPFGLGTAPLGGWPAIVDEDVARETIARAYELGVRLFDTAPLYGHGRSERRLGEVLRDKPRESFTLTTKVGRLLRADAHGPTLFAGEHAAHPVFDFSYDGTLRSLEESLERLGLDRIDAAYIHDPDDHYEQALAGAYPALERLRSEGVLKAIGVGMNQSAMLARFAAEGDFDVFLLAGRYTLLEQDSLDVLLPACAEHGVELVLGGVLNSGLLVNPGPASTYNYEPAPHALIARAQQLQAVCERHAVPLPAAAIQFAAAQPLVASVLHGPRSAAELEQNVELAARPIPSDLWADLRDGGLIRADAPVPA